MQTMLGMRKDFILSNLCSQVEQLRSVLIHIKKKNNINDFYADQSLRVVEDNLRKIKKLCVNA